MKYIELNNLIVKRKYTNWLFGLIKLNVSDKCLSWP